MPKCPKCKKNINRLIAYEDTTIVREYRLGLNPSVFAGLEKKRLGGDIVFECPNCEEELFKDSQSAEEFLKRGSKSGDKHRNKKGV